MACGESFTSLKPENIIHQSFFPPLVRELLDIHKQIAVSISGVGKEQGESIAESEGQNCQKVYRCH